MLSNVLIPVCGKYGAVVLSFATGFFFLLQKIVYRMLIWSESGVSVIRPGNFVHHELEIKMTFLTQKYAHSIICPLSFLMFGK